MAVLRLENITKEYRRGRSSVPAIRHLDLSVEDGELVSLVGPSGSGKTTLLRLIAGLERPDQGTVHIAGRSVNDVAPQHRDVALVFQGYALYPHMTVYGNLTFGLRAHGVPRAQADAMAREAAEVVEAAHLLDRRPHELSGGEQQRVALGRAIVRKPKVLLLDEPLSNLDAPLRLRMRQQIKSLQRRLSLTTVHVTHDQEEAMAMGHRMAVLNDGQVQQFDRPPTIYAAPANRFVAGFIGSPPMNFLEGKIEIRDGLAWFVGKGLRLNVPGSDWLGSAAGAGTDVVLGVRPQHIHLTHSACAGSPNNVSAEIEWLEPILGGHLVGVRTSSGQALIAEIGGSRDPAFVDLGSVVYVETRLADLHLFSLRDGARLR